MQLIASVYDSKTIRTYKRYVPNNVLVRYKGTIIYRYFGNHRGQYIKNNYQEY